MEDIPFTKFEGSVKCLRRASLENEEIVDIAFPHFLDKQEGGGSVEPTQWTQEVVKGLIDSGRKVMTELSSAPRRFSGDGSLPRNRYYTLCTDSGDDSQTLAQELLAYADRKVVTNVIDLCDPRFDDVRKHVEEGAAARGFASGSGRPFIRVSLTKPQARESAAWKWMNKQGVPEHVDRIAVNVQSQISSLLIDKVIDLRLPQTREWVQGKLREGVREITYSVDGKITSNLPLLQTDIIRPAREWPEKFDSIGDLEPSKGWSGGRHRSVNAWHGLVGYLTFAELGGSAMTRALGAWFRSLGAQSLIYPSARNDVMVEMLNGALVRHYGFCLVDYRGAEKPYPEAYVVHEPESWVGGLPGVEVQVPEEPEYAGSFKITGNFDAHRRVHETE